MEVQKSFVDCPATIVQEEAELRCAVPQESEAVGRDGQTPAVVAQHWDGLLVVG